MKHTPSQKKAIHAKGNILVVAGAGTGKTRTLIDRCMKQLIDPEEKTTLLEILMVTFTEAAATEMKERIADRLEQALENDPQNADLQEKLAQIDAASIGTLHSFCLNLIRQHFHLLVLDPQARVLEAEEVSSIEQQTLDELLDQHYSGTDELSESVRRYVAEFENGWDKGLREWILKIHRYSCAMVDPDGWLLDQSQSLILESPGQWYEWLVEEMQSWSKEWISDLSHLPEENTNAIVCLKILNTFNASDPSLESLTDCVEELAHRDHKDHWPRGCKTKHREPMGKLLDDAAFLATLCPSEDSGNDPLKEDWNWYRERARTLLELTRAFSARFKAKKLERGGVDFTDLEQSALTLLWNRKTKQATDLAESIQRQFKHVYVDEYQDINAAQDCILGSISGNASRANRFLVGDVKQSIYGFRLANPQFFNDYEKTWNQPNEEEPRQVVYLQENFRSRPGILTFVNDCFSELMASNQGFNERAHLLFGDPDNRAETLESNSSSVECHFLLSEVSSQENDASLANDMDLSNTEKEAWAIGLRLKKLSEGGHLVLDSKTRSPRKVRWSDMAILMRSVRSKADAYSRVFSQLGIPLQVPRSGMLERSEISDILSLLMLLDNPRQDIPLIAVLRSPLAGLSNNQLALIRIGTKKANFWKALNQFSDQPLETLLPDDLKEDPEAQSAKQKVQLFLQQFHQWRQSGRQLNLSRRLECILNDTLYMETLSASETEGKEAIMHVQQLLRMARQFDHYQQKGLSRFLQYIENKRASETEFDLDTADDGQTVQLMSIHKSKGLEFPVVAVTGLGNTFNFQDVQQTWMLDESLGLAGMIQPPGEKPRYPSLPLWICRRRRKAENLQEELRLLYVAFTRAKDLLVLIGATSEQKMKKWSQLAEETHQEIRTTHARCAMDWLFPWLTRYWKDSEWWLKPKGSNRGVDWHIHSKAQTQDSEPEHDPVIDEEQTFDKPTWINRWLNISGWQYPNPDASHHPAKATVTMLRKKHQIEIHETESASWFDERSIKRKVSEKPTPDGLSPGEKGTIHHHFLQWLDLDNDMTMDLLAEQRDQMIDSGHLDPRANDALNLSSIAAFWHSDIGQSIRTHRDQLHRELPFTARFELSELKALGLAQQIKKEEAREFVIIQGIVDVAILRNESIQILDYKTDQIELQGLSGKLDQYRPQIELYAQALQRIYQRPVTHKWLHFLAVNQTIEMT